MENSVMDLREVIGLAGVPVVVALVEVAKRSLPGMSDRWYPACSLIVALGLNLGIGWRLGLDVVTVIVTGVVVGLAASGLYSQVKTVKPGADHAASR
ncbi:MAG: transposase [Chloroflexi bacterium]|nr:transposase [Chloroflexota bacterium]